MLLHIAVLALLPNIVSAIEGDHDTISVENENGIVSFDAEDGSIVALRQKEQPDPILSSGEEGLWDVRFADGSQIRAADFSSSSAERSFEYTSDPQANALQMTFRSSEIQVVITIHSRPDGVELTGEITPRSKTLLDFALPARLRFKPDNLDRFICPMNGNQSVGTAFKGAFFQRQPREEPTAREPQLIGTKGPVRYLHYSVPYPAAFADFFHLDTQIGSASIYRVQPGGHAPWEGAKNPDAIFVPGRLALGGDERGGYCDRVFGTYVPPGRTWRSPRVRLAIGCSAAESLQAYCEANGINRRLEDKMPTEVLEKFRNSVLVYYGGNCGEKLEHVNLLPVPSQIHFADYLKGGFDKQYPDHLPPHPDFGTPEEFSAFFDRCHQLGHLVMPYTNPTWWCDDPKGPTFEKEGDAALLRNLDGSLSRERYGSNEGYTICHWHPAVRAANQRTVHQFTEEYPVDILFQDQCGARSWHYDTNPASPTPYAYIEGLLSMIAEDSQVRPLSTESGWDRVVNYESQLCGMSWSIVPTVGGPSWRTFMKHQYPPETWEIFPLAQYIAHDKTAMLYHDLGQFVTNRQVLAWTLGLGFCMSYRINAPMLKQDARREWLRWLDRIQKSVCSRYVGEPLYAFEHDRGSAIGLEDDGVMRATYGSVEIVANLGPKERTEQNHELPPYGFHATAPGMIAANLKRLGGIDFGDDGISFVVERRTQDTDIWVYERPGREVCCELPDSGSGSVSLVTDDGSAIQATFKDGILRFCLPGKVAEIRHLWHIIAHYDL